MYIHIYIQIRVASPFYVIFAVYVVLSQNYGHPVTLHRRAPVLSRFDNGNATLAGLVTSVLNAAGRSCRASSIT